ncbi:MAG: hypothetical protein M3409_11220 [Gemmatimonadota bacterium]|nr:hypothetical protein [Gemmatimonadota bacterium]
MTGVAVLFLMGLLVSPIRADAQELPRARNAAYLELLGNGLLYSVNYDRLFSERISGRVGAALLAADSSESAGRVLAVPIMVNYLAGTGNGRLEAGIGALVLTGEAENVEGSGNESFAGVAGTATLGYRYQPLNGGFVFRAGFTPLLSGGRFFPWLGISAGYAF